jgi:hypothetical protein
VVRQAPRVLVIRLAPEGARRKQHDYGIAPGGLPPSTHRVTRPHRTPLSALSCDRSKERPDGSPRKHESAEELMLPWPLMCRRSTYRFSRIVRCCEWSARSAVDVVYVARIAPVLVAACCRPAEAVLWAWPSGKSRLPLLTISGSIISRYPSTRSCLISVCVSPAFR